MSFNRNRAQLNCEQFLGANTPESWESSDFKNFILSSDQSYTLKNSLKLDSIDFYFKGILSFFEALNSLKSYKLFSWATIKLYYSAYYFIRSHLAARNIAIIRKGGLYYIRAFANSTPVSKSNKKYNSDHGGTINHYCDLFPDDILLSQSINSQNPYTWLMSRREQVNYKDRVFHDPSPPDFWKSIAENEKSLSILLKEYKADQFILCFQEEHSILALPLKRAELTLNELKKEGIHLILEEEKIDLLSNLVGFELEFLKYLFQPSAEVDTHA